MMDAYEGIDINFFCLLSLPIKLKMEKFPIKWDQLGNVKQWSQEDPLTEYNQFSCSKLKFDPKNRTTKFHNVILSKIVPCGIEEQCFQLARYIVSHVMPIILNKHKRSIETPILMHYRCRFTLHNLALNWIFIMLMPDQVQLNIIDMLKIRGIAGLWNTFYAACGQTQYWY